jgi:hypothetical protein
MEAEKQNIALLSNKYKAEIVTPAQASAEKAVLNAKADVSSWFEVAKAELAQTEVTLDVVNDDSAYKAWLIDNFDAFFKPFTETLKEYPAKHVSVITGLDAGAERPPISAIEPDALARVRNDLVKDAFKQSAAPQSAAAPVKEAA